MRAMLIAVSLFLASPPAAEGDVYISGGGNQSCGRWLEAKNNTSLRYQGREWVFGFVSGMNWSNPDRQARIADNAAMTAFVDQYCTNNPLHPLLQAALALVSESGGPKTSHEWKK